MAVGARVRMSDARGASPPRLMTASWFRLRYDLPHTKRLKFNPLSCCQGELVWPGTVGGLVLNAQSIAGRNT
jgi:hypothetical protein